VLKTSLTLLLIISFVFLFWCVMLMISCFISDHEYLCLDHLLYLYIFFFFSYTVILYLSSIMPRAKLTWMSWENTWTPGWRNPLNQTIIGTRDMQNSTRPF
jgi:hypothetical protein